MSVFVQGICDRGAFQFRLYAVLDVALEFLSLGPRRYVEGMPHELEVVSLLNPDRTFAGQFLVSSSATFLAASRVIAFGKVAAVERLHENLYLRYATKLKSVS